MSDLLTAIKDAIIEYVRNVDVIDIFELCKGYTFVHRGDGYYCHQHDNLVVRNDRISWFDNSKDMSGRGIMDYLLNVENLSFREALEVLANMDVGEPPTE